MALDELALHGWDLARATGQPFRGDPVSLQAGVGFAASMAEPGDVDRLLRLAGRDPRWAPSATAPSS